jgi:anaerobic selenocysteine-containing dehydrogenase
VVVPLSDRHAPSDSGVGVGEQIEVQATWAQGETLLPETEPAPDPAAESAAVNGGRPPQLRFVAAANGRPAPPVDAYSLRLVTGRRLYDAGVMVQRSPALAQLVAPQAQFFANPTDLDQVGVRDGDQVRVWSPRGSVVLPAVADPAMPRGCASLDANLPGPGANDLIDATLLVTEVRLETVK